MDTILAASSSVLSPALSAPVPLPALALLAVGIGFVAGLRSLTAPAVVSWAARLGWIHLAGSGLAFMGSLPAVCILSLAALGELVVDKLPSTPARTSPFPLTARVLLGALAGATLAAGAGGGAGPATGALCGVAGALLGTFGGYQARVRLVRALGGADLPVALLEDLVAIGGALLIASRL